MIKKLTFIFILWGYHIHATSFAAWPNLNISIYQYNKMNVSLHAEHWTTEGLRDTNFSLASIRLKNSTLPHVDFGLNGSLLRYAQREKKYQSRLEFEVNPYIKRSRWSIKTRNRLELRNSHGTSDESNRFRHKLQFNWNILSDKQSLFHSYELFYDIKLDYLTNLRVVPLGYSRSTSFGSFNLFYLIQKSKATYHWHNQHVVGITLNLALDKLNF